MIAFGGSPFSFASAISAIRLLFLIYTIIRTLLKSMKMSYELTGNENVPVLTGVTIRCHTNKCTKVTVLKNHTEGLLTARADATFN